MSYFKKNNKTSNNIKLLILHLNQCDPKKCTAKKLFKKDLAKELKETSKMNRKALVLDPFSSKIISIKDKEIANKYGLVGIDCSWDKTETIFKRKFENGRALPSLLAVNPINYGKWNRLSTVEAMSAALYILGYDRQAKEILRVFSWGEQFFIINKKIFENLTN